MSTKDKVLKALEFNRGEFISGQELADTLNISRTAVWKSINSLREDGFLIKSVTNKGYRLEEDNDIINSFGIKSSLIDDLKNIDILIFDEIDSTNTYAKILVNSTSVKNFTVIVSNRQTSGRGRRGKNFSSPKDSGIYMSIILKPENTVSFYDFDFVTIRVAVSVFLAIKSVSDSSYSIKWVNDIYKEDKKVCGILCEMDADFETKSINNVIVGIGVNVKTPSDGFDREIKDIATAIDEKFLKRNKLIAEILNQFYKVNKMSVDEVLEIYRKNSYLKDKEVEFLLNGKKYNARVEDINEKGNLIVKTDDGQMILSSGEVSVKRRKI